jgi:hypothetical protein
MLAGWIGRDDGLAVSFGKLAATLAGLVGAVGDELAGRGDTWQACARADEILGVARRDGEGERTASLVGRRVNVGRPSAARAADRVNEVPPFAPVAEWCALTWVESMAADETTPLDRVRA